ncbi:flagellar protein FlaG [Aliikangiella sp. IMCC44653]
MAIYNLSGNFQPPQPTSGSSLPSSEGRAPSAANAETETDLRAVNTVSPTDYASDVSKLTERKQPNAEKEAASEIEELQNFNQSIDRSLQFKVDEELGVTIVRVVDKQTDELIRQFPPEELINLSKRLKELNEENVGSRGILLQEKV